MRRLKWVNQQLRPEGVPERRLVPAVQRTVDLTFQGDRNQLYAAWNAVANLADMAGKVSVSVRAESEKGFDKNRLENGVLEPLKEADLIE